MSDHGISFGEATRVWVQVALRSFGGPAGQIAVMHQLLVEEKRWIGEERFLHALNYCMLLPGPEAQQLATYIGWLLHGTRGGLVAGLMFVLPGFLSILGLSIAYVALADTVWVEGLFYGLKAAVLAVVVEAVIRIGRRVLTNPARIALAVGAFVGIFFLELPFPTIVLGAALVGLIGERLIPSAFAAPPVPDASRGRTKLDELLDARAHTPTLLGTARVAAAWLAIWWAPLIAIALVLGPDHVLARIGVFFSQCAVFTFGGAYAALAYVAQEAVERHGWLGPGEMLDGLGMAETTPGPLIQVVQFVGFLGAYRDPGGFTPMTAGVLGAIVTTWATFSPCFLWIFTGAPYIEWLRGNTRWSAALSSITAAVVGVILNLAVWFALHVLFGVVREVDGPLGLRALVPDLGTLDPAAAAIAIGAGAAMLGLRVPMLPTLGVAAGIGLLVRILA